MLWLWAFTAPRPGDPSCVASQKSDDVLLMHSRGAGRVATSTSFSLRPAEQPLTRLLVGTHWQVDNPDKAAIPAAAPMRQRALASVNRYRALISLVFRLGIESGKVKENPARLVKPRQVNNTRTDG
jgi:hypothetical protein